MSLGVGVIGAGVMGAYHARLLRDSTGGAHLAAVCDADPSRAVQAAGEARTFSGPLALIADPGVGAVVVASPDATHAPLALACLRVGSPFSSKSPSPPRQRRAGRSSRPRWRLAAALSRWATCDALTGPTWR